jgi:hypothetical protein
MTGTDLIGRVLAVASFRLRASNKVFQPTAGSCEITHWIIRMMLPELRNRLQAYADGRVADGEFHTRLDCTLVNEAPELALPGGPLDESAAEALVSQLLLHF